MIDPNFFLEKLVDHDFKFFTGVPCSYLTPFMELLDNHYLDIQYITASNEGEALSLASGASLAGKRSIVLCQNSGLGNMVNPITSLSTPFLIPTLLLITWRGHPEEIDEPQHQLMGTITTELLDLMKIKWSFFPETKEELLFIIKKSIVHMEMTKLPYALLIRKDSFLGNSQKKLRTMTSQISREEALQAIINHTEDSNIIITTTGKTSRELFTLSDRPNHLYCVGSMGYASALAHGIALNTKQKIFIIDGDGAAIMHLGNFTTIGSNTTSNLVHIILDNQVYDSTGAQSTTSKSLDFALIAKGSGYKHIYSCKILSDFTKALQESKNFYQPVFIHLPIQMGSMKNLGRPTLSPEMVANRLQNFILRTMEA